MAFFGGGDSFSRSFNTTLDSKHYTPSGTPRPSSVAGQGVPRPSSAAGQGVSRPSPGCEDTVSLSNEAQGGPATESANDFHLRAMQMQQQIREAQLANFLKHAGL